MSLTSKKPLQDVARDIEGYFEGKGLSGKYVIAYDSDSKGEKVEVREREKAGLMGRLFSKPLVQVARERGLRSDMPSYSIQDENALPSEVLKQIIYGDRKVISFAQESNGVH